MKHSNTRVLTIILLLAFSTLSNFTIVHPIHISVMEIHYNEQKSNFEIAVKIFADDLEDGIRDIGATKIKLNQGQESENADDWIKKYLKQNLNIVINDQQLDVQFSGKEYEEYAVWSYLEVGNLTEINSLKIENTILQDLYEDQKNLIHFYKNKKRIQTSIFNHHKTEIEINL